MSAKWSEKMSAEFKAKLGDRGMGVTLFGLKHTKTVMGGGVINS